MIIHAGAISSADAVRREPEAGWSVNTRATEVLCDWAGERGRRLLFTSTDLVFDGTRPWNRESDPANPVVEYGRTKLAAEAHVLANRNGLVARLSMLFGPSTNGRAAYFDQAIAALRAGATQAFFEDEFRTPLDYVTAASILVRLAGTDATGVVHVGGPLRLSRLELMKRAATAMGADEALVQANRRAVLASLEPRPADVSLDTSRLRAMFPDLVVPTVEEALRTTRR